MEIKELGHVVLYVRDLERSRAFYRDVLGFREIFAIPSAAAGYSSGRTHHELVLPQKEKSEQNQYEFDVDKSKAFQQRGPLGIRLKKANVKHQYADLELLLDGHGLSQKHVNLYQPVTFYKPGTSQPLELVISSIDTKRIRGYVTIPKYRQPQLASMSNSNAQSGVSMK